MRKELVINKHVYRPAEMTFNAICDLEDMGVTIDSMERGRMLAPLRAYLALCMTEPDPAKAGKEIEAHIVGGGDLTELTECMMEAFEESGFFRALSKGQEAPAPEDQKKTIEKEA